MTNCNYSEHTKIQRKKIQNQIQELQEKLQKLEEQDPEMLLLRQGKVDFVDYDRKKYIRIEYTDSFADGYNWYVRRIGEDAIRPVRDVNVYASLEELYQKEVVKQKDDYPYKIADEPEEQKWDVVRESLKWCEEHPDKDPLDWVKPQTPEQVADGLREAFREAQKTEKWKEIQKKIDAPAEGIYDNIDIDKLLEKWDEDPPEFLRFVLGPTLEDRIYKWWDTCFVQHPEWSMEECVEDLLDIITLFLPAEQNSEGTQRIETIIAVDTHNELLRKIKSKLRNKKDT